VAGVLRASPALPAQLLAVATFLVLGASEGGYYPGEWYAAGLFLLALLAVTVLALGVARPPRATLAGLALFAGYALWSHLSILWSAADGVALEGAGRTTVYLAVVCLFALWPLDGTGARVLQATLGLGLAAIGLVELLRVDAAAEPLSFFDDIRFSEPLGYMNGNVAMWAIGMLACLATASARDVPVAARAPALGGAAVLGTLSLMGQSRGWALALPVALLAFVALGPGRPRKLLAVVAVAGACALSAGAALGLHDDFAAASFDSQLSDAVRAALLAGLVATALGLLGALLDRRLPARRQPPLQARRLAGGALAAGTVVVLAVLLLFGGLGDRLGDTWDRFKSGEAHAEEGSSRFSNVGTNRYDVWRVAWDVAADNPVGGVGADGFQPEYLRRGSTDEQPRFAHSLELGVLAQTGWIGAGLLFGALAALLWSALVAVRTAPAVVAAAAGAAVSVFVYWLAHGSVDWFWELPALAGMGLGTLGMAAALRPAPPAGAARPGRGAAALVIAGAVAIGVSLLLPWLAERNISRAGDLWRADVGGALRLLDDAASLNPLSARPGLTAGTIALRVEDFGRAEQEFEEALAREPKSSYALLELGLIASVHGERRRAVDLLERAVALSPRDRVARAALRAARRGRRLDPAAVNQRILERARERASDAL
jgi:hypothetical protein